jgi:hypothetical protein
MKSILKALSAVALTGVMVLPVLADDATTTNDGTDSKDLKKVIEDQGINYVETAQKGITLSGYVDVSFTQQFAGRGGPFDSSASSQHQFDLQGDGFNVQAVKIALEKALPDKNEWAAGFRIDTIYGEDARLLPDAGFNSPAGNVFATPTNTSGLALEQALVKFRIPVGNGLDIYAGKFVTFLGYEVIESPANPNFSRGLLFTDAIPLTHTGVYADYKFNDTFEAKFGVVDGWNNSTSLTSSDNNASYAFGGKAITGQLNINAPGKNANLTQSFIYSPDSNEGFGGGTDNGPSAVYDVWGNWNPTFDKSGNLTLGFNIDFGYNGASGSPATPSAAAIAAGGPGAGFGAPTEDSNTWWGAALYAQYKLTKTVTLAGRAEYLHSDAAEFPKFGAVATSPGAELSQDDWSETLTASFAVWDNLLTRAEYRCDVLSAGTTGTGQSSVQNEVSLEAVYSF